MQLKPIDISRERTVPNERFVQDTLAKLRLRLLDLTARNPLISFKHAARSRRFVRVIDELPDQLYARLAAEAGMRFKSLGEETTEPEDEKTIEFRRGLDAAKLEDPDYLQKLRGLGEDPGERALERLEEELRVHLRLQLGMPARKPIVASTAGDVAMSRGLNPSFDLPLVLPEQSADQRHTDSTIQTLLFEDPMEATLARMREQVRLSLDEAGVNPLFCVFGFLEWYEDGNSAVPLHAPLLLYPLNIDRKLVRGQYQYTVQSTGEDAQVNVALAERLKRDFQIHLPPYNEGDTPEKYFGYVQKVIERQRSWKVRRWITLGLFSFARIAMYHDLDPQNWEPQGGLHRHTGLNRLIGGENVSAGETSVVGGADEPVDSTKDELDIPLISDADSSQLAAIRDVLAGRSMVIEGPPGTGKSQTITNIIAAALAQGKSVLFLAEKMAALNVVRDRLVHAQLDEFCLELHSTKAGRRETFNAIARRLGRQNGRNMKPDLDSTLAEMATLRERLSACVEALGRTAGKLGVTTQELLWLCYRARARTTSLPPELDEIVIDGVEAFTELDVGRLASLAQQFEKARQFIVDRWGSVPRNPWNGVARHDLNPFQAEDVVRRVARLADVADRAEKSRQALISLTGLTIGKTAELNDFAPAAAIPDPDRGVDEPLVSHMADAQALAVLERFAEALAQHSILREALSSAFENAAALDAALVQDLVAMTDAAAAAGFGAAVVSQGLEFAQKNRQRAALWSEIGTLAAHIADCAGLAPTLTPPLERSLLAAVDLAAEATPDLLARRTPALLAPGTSGILRRGKEQLKTLRERREALSTAYVLDTPLDPNALRAHAASLRAAPLLPFLSPSWWRAKAAFKALCKAPSSLKRHEMAAVMDRLADLKDDLTTFQSNAELMAAVGHSFKALSTDFDPILGVAEWGDRVRLALRAIDEPHACLIRRLCDGTVEQLQGLAALATDAQMPNLKKVCADTARTAPVEAHARAAQVRAEQAARALSLAEKLRLRPTVPFSAARELAARLQRLRELRDEIDDSRLAKATLADKFAGAATPTQPILASAKHVRAVLATNVSAPLRQWLLQADAVHRLEALRPVAAEAATAVAEVVGAVDQLTRIVLVDFKMWIGVTTPIATQPHELRDHAARCATSPEGLQALIEDARLLHECREAGLGPVLDLLEGHRAPLRDLGLAAKRVIYQSMARAAISRSPSLAVFTGERHEGNRRAFRDLDHKLARLRQTVIAEGVARQHVERGSDNGPRKQWTGLALIHNEASKQRAHIPIRHLMDRAGRSVQQLMPCFMMSPLSVAQYLTPGALAFDLIIMDEASQLRPEDAIGAIARGSQLVVVGDPKQLPPTSFFSGAVDSAEDDGLDEEGGTAADEQSILDQALVIMRPAKRLKWHYRSQHPSLIAFSNKEFYNNQLILFPTPFQENDNYGVRYVHVPAGRYRSHLNVPEARHVAAEVIEYVKKHPERSLGVVTMNKPQAELLSLEIDRLATEHEEFEEWRRSREETLEPFFVKNLENVQGDERDVIFISTVYGRDEEGNFHQRFGPIVNEGGHRRLNVLFSRSKMQTVVFSTMDPADIRTAENSKWGIRALKGYLKFAKDGVLDLPTETGREPDSDFEIAVTEAIRDAGFAAVPQVGVAGYFIDVGVRHPTRAGEFVLGVECDGATYHSSKSARDRDRLRQEILERLRWRIHRIWSLDWYRSPIREKDRLLQAIKVATVAADA